jgi:hypothetical protein
MGRYEAIAQSRGLVVLDAVNRAWRTLWQAIGAGVIVTIGDLGLKLLETGDVFTGDFWGSLIKGALTALITAVLAYAARFKLPPPPVPETTTLPTPPAEPGQDKGPFAG